MQNIIAALLVLSLVILPGPVSAQAQTQTTRTDYPITVDETNPCNGEMVQLTGTGHLVMHFTFDNAGGIHIVDITNTMGPLRGVALLSGTVYQANQTVSSTVNDNGQTPQFEFTFVMSETLISQGATPNFVAHTTVHATVSSNALVTANVLNIKTECSGQ